MRRAREEGLPRDHNMCRDGDDLCLPCDEQCSGCTWFDDAHCIECKHLRLYEDEENKEGRVRTPTVPLLFYAYDYPFVLFPFRVRSFLLVRSGFGCLNLNVLRDSQLTLSNVKLLCSLY